MPPARARRVGKTPLNERAFHAWLSRRLPWGSAGLLPLGDDAAALRPPEGELVVASVDSFVQGHHFLPDTPPELLGRAAVAAGLSDVASKGARPCAILLAVVVPVGTPQRWAERLVLGAERTAAAAGAHVVGGDTKPGPTPMVAGVAFGWAPPDRLRARSAARPGELLVTTGTVGRGGASSIGLSERGPRRERAVARMLELTARVREGPVLARYARAQLDTSDGLAESARLLARASRVRVVVDEASLPWDRRLLRLPPERRRTIGFYGGDYELLATVPPSVVGRARAALARLGCPLRVIGTIGIGRGAFLRVGAREIELPHAGWQPFE